MNCQNKEIVCSAFINLINIEAQVEKQSSKFYDDNHIRNTNFKTKFLATTECQWSLLTNWWCYKKCVCIKYCLAQNYTFPDGAKQTINRPFDNTAQTWLELGPSGPVHRVTNHGWKHMFCTAIWFFTSGLPAGTYWDAAMPHRIGSVCMSWYKTVFSHQSTVGCQSTVNRSRWLGSHIPGHKC